MDRGASGPSPEPALLNARPRREMVANAGRDARVGKTAICGGDVGDDRLRPVAPGHRQGIRATIERSIDEP